MKTERGVRQELAKAKRLYQNRSKPGFHSSEWRDAFDEGTIQALSWVLGDGKKPTGGYELRFRRDAEKK